MKLVSKSLFVATLSFLMLITVPAYAFDIVNTSKNEVLFSDDYEIGVLGQAPGAQDATVGSWEWNGTAVAEIVDLSSAGFPAISGRQFLKMARDPDRPTMTANGDAAAAANSVVDDVVDIRFSVRVTDGLPTVYPRVRQDDGSITDSGQVSFFPDGQVRIWNPTAALFTEAKHTIDEWNTVIIRKVNGSDELSVSVNGSAFETAMSVSSEDNGTGGSIIGARIQTDGGGTFFFDDYASPYIELYNVTKDEVVFRDNFEIGILGEGPGADDALVGSWEYNGNPVAEIADESSAGFGANEGDQFLTMARDPERPTVTAIGDPDAAANSEDGDIMEIRLSLRVDDGLPTIYPRARQGDGSITDSGQTSFFPDGQVRIWNPTDALFTEQTHTLGLWNSVIIRYVNGSGEHSVSVNGAPFETHPSTSSEDNGSGGDFVGFRIQTDGGGYFHLDGFGAPQQTPAEPEVVLGQQGFFMIKNIDKDVIMFADSFERGTIGEAPGTDDPEVGTWNWNGEAIAEVMDSGAIFPAEGRQFLHIARAPDRPKLTAIGDPDAAAQSEDGDTIEISYSFLHDGGFASIYPRAGDSDSAQITFFPDGEARIYGGDAVGWQILDQTYNPGVWNHVVIQYVNGSGEYSVSINGAQLETYPGVSSDDGGSGGNVDGARLQADGADTFFYIDGVLPPFIEVYNVTKGETIFRDNFENGALGSGPGTDDPEVGTWDYNGETVAELVDSSEGFDATEGEQFLKVVRDQRPKVTAIGEAGAAARSEAGDMIEIKLSFRVDGDLASLYPRSGDSDGAQFGFFGNGEVRIYDGSAWVIFEQRHNPKAWNTAILRHINGEQEWSVSVNGQPFETAIGVSSDDNGTGGNTTGFRIQTDGNGAFYIDAFAPTIFNPPLPDPSPGGLFTIRNLTKEEDIFADNFEDATLDGIPDAPQLGSWEHNGENTTRVQAWSESLFPAEGHQFVSIARDPDRPRLTAVGDPTAAANGAAGDLIELRFSIMVETGFASIYPRAGDGDNGQITFFGDGRIRVWEDTSATFLDATHNPGQWNRIVIQYINDSGEFSTSVNGGAFEKVASNSSDDGGRGGNLTGVRFMGDGTPTIFHVDAEPLAPFVELVNLTKGQVVFQDNFEADDLGAASGNAAIGSWDWNEAPVAEVTDGGTAGFAAAEGAQFLKVAREGSRPTITAVGDADAAAASADGDLMEIRFSMRVTDGLASIYPRAGDGDSAQISFFPNGEARIYSGAALGWTILNQRHNVGFWNAVTLQYINGSGEYSMSVNGAPFESAPGVSSEDNGTGGNLTGFRFQTDGGGAYFLDGFNPSVAPQIPLELWPIGATPTDLQITGVDSFILTGSGTMALNAAGDEVAFMHEELAGDFDKMVRIESIASDSADGRGGIMVRSSMDAPDAVVLKLTAMNSTGANSVAAYGRMSTGVGYTRFGREVGGVGDTVPNQYLRMRRIGNDFSMYVGSDGQGWTLLAERYVADFPALAHVGVYAGAASGDGQTTATVNFAGYGDVSENVLLKVVSTGSFNGQTIGVQFSGPIASSTVVAENFTVQNEAGEAVAIDGVDSGIGGDSAYVDLTAPLPSAAFTVIVNNVTDPSGNNAVEADSTVAGMVQPWMSADIGAPGDPAVMGESIALSSSTKVLGNDENLLQADLFGGGSSFSDNGDFGHILYQEVTGDFDMMVEVNRFDRSSGTDGSGFAGLVVRESLYLNGQENTAEGTKVRTLINATYAEGNEDIAAQTFWRDTNGGNYGSSDPVMAGSAQAVGRYGRLIAANSGGGTQEGASSTGNRWLRLMRVGNDFNSYYSDDGLEWVDYNTATLDLAATVLVGFSGHTGSAGTDPENYNILTVRNLGAFVDMRLPSAGVPTMLTLRNLTKGEVIFSTGFEASAVGGIPGETDPEVGSWRIEGEGPILQVEASGPEVTARECNQFLHIGRLPARPQIVAVGDESAAANSEAGDVIEIRLAMLYLGGAASIYPKQGLDVANDSAQISVLPVDEFTAQIAVWDPVGSFKTANDTIAIGEWTQIAIRYVNGSGLWQVSVNGGEFSEPLLGFSSDDNMTGGNITGIKFKTDNAGTDFYLDGEGLPPFIEVYNVTDDEPIFSGNFEAGSVGSEPGAGDPLLGQWEPNGEAVLEITDNDTENIVAPEGFQYVKIARESARPKLTAVGDADASARSGDGDVVEIRFSFYSAGPGGVASIYPRTAAGSDNAQISFFHNEDGGQLRIYGGAAIGWNILDDQAWELNAWNLVVLRYVNGTGMWQASVNCKPFSDPVVGVSSEDNGTGGNVTGFRWQIDNSGTTYYVDAYHPAPGGAFEGVLLTHSPVGIQAGAASAFLKEGTGFGVVGSGFLPYDNFGDVLSYYHQTELVPGDFDLAVKVTDIVSEDADGRGGIMVRTQVGSDPGADVSQVLKLTAFNPNGRNTLEVWGKPQDNASYEQFGGPVEGVDQMLPNLWLRMTRVGDMFTQYYGTDSDWIQIDNPVTIDFPDEIYWGVYSASATGIDGGGMTETTVHYEDYGPYEEMIGPVTLNYNVVGATMTLSWDGDGFVLQASDDLWDPGKWTNVPGGDTSPVVITMDDGILFFRLILP